ncbi:MAG TPA: hypothetical protein VFX15_00230 [Actinomycetes bacterium]|nr:hypothetical protein [Actinomycetes bacterium]
MSNVDDSLLRYLLQYAGQQASPEQQNLYGMIPQVDPEGDPVTLTSQLNQLQDVNQLISNPIFQGMGGIGGFGQQTFAPTVNYEMVDSPEYQRWRNYLNTPESFEGMVALELQGGGTPYSAMRKIQQAVTANPEGELAQTLAMLFPQLDFDNQPTGEINWAEAAQGATQIDEIRAAVPQLGGAASYTMPDGSVVPGGEIMEVDGQLVRRTEEPSELMQAFTEAGLPSPYAQYTAADFLPPEWSDAPYLEAAANTDALRQAMVQATDFANADLNPPPEAIRAQMEQRWGPREQAPAESGGGGGGSNFVAASETFDDWLSGRSGPANSLWDWASRSRTPWQALGETQGGQELRANVTGNPLPGQAAGIGALGGIWNWLQEGSLPGRMGVSRGVDAETGGGAPTGLNPSGNVISDVGAGVLGGLRDFLTEEPRGSVSPTLGQSQGGGGPGMHPRVLKPRGMPTDEPEPEPRPDVPRMLNNADFINQLYQIFPFLQSSGERPQDRAQMEQAAMAERLRNADSSYGPQPTQGIGFPVSGESSETRRQQTQGRGFPVSGESAATREQMRQRPVTDAMLAAILPSGPVRAPRAEPDRPPRSEGVDWYPQATPGRMTTGEQLPASERVDWYGGPPEGLQGESYEVTTGTEGTRQAQANRKSKRARSAFRKAWEQEQRAKQKAYGYDYGYAQGMAASARRQGINPLQQVMAQRMQNIIGAGIPLQNQPGLVQY